MKLDNQTRELIAVGASVAANCQPCVQLHVDQALENGADEQAVAEALEMGRTVREGTAGKMDKFLLDFFVHLLPWRRRLRMGGADVARIMF